MKSVQNDHPGMREAIGRSEVFLTFLEQVSNVAKVDRPILVVGERGSGKELVAARLHYMSSRWDGPLVTLNCASLAADLLDAELFGHEAGAFTGALARRPGRFERADQGTLFLDEIATLTMAAQEKVLRAVEYGRFERVGGADELQADVRIVGATNADLPAMAKKGDFKADLLDRLGFCVLKVPPLREREEDILLLARHFASRMAAELDLPALPELSPDFEQDLVGYHWPGNVRELKNVVERAVFMAGHAETVERIPFDPFAADPMAKAEDPANSENPDGVHAETPNLLHDHSVAPASSASLPEQVDALKLQLIQHAQKKALHNGKEAAKLLGITYHQYRGLLRKYSERL